MNNVLVECVDSSDAVKINQNSWRTKQLKCYTVTLYVSSTFYKSNTSLYYNYNYNFQNPIKRTAHKLTANICNISSTYTSCNIEISNSFISSLFRQKVIIKGKELENGQQKVLLNGNMVCRFEVSFICSPQYDQCFECN